MLLIPLIMYTTLCTRPDLSIPLSNVLLEYSKYIVVCKLPYSIKGIVFGIEFAGLKEGYKGRRRSFHISTKVAEIAKVARCT